MLKLYSLTCLCLILIFKIDLNTANFIEENDEDILLLRHKQEMRIEENRQRCMLNNSNEISSNSDVKKCPKTFDQILCWDETPANQWAEQRCPDWFIGFENQKEKAKRFCRSDGTWTPKKNSSQTYTDYTMCIENLDAKLLSSHLPKLKLIAKIGSILSLASLILAIILLIGFKRLHCARNILHVNLFASFLLFSILQLIKETFWIRSVGFPKDVIIEGSSKLMFNPNVTHWECKTLMTFYRYAESSNHVMVFCEALYLNTLVSVSTFSESNHFKFYITAGWVGPLIWIVPFVILMAIFGNDNSCWNMETKFSYFYVIPQVALIFNKLRKNRLTESKQYRYKKLAKSTLILLPLFSIYYIAFSVWQPFVRGKLSVELELIRLYFEIICSSFQGLIISFIYCFFNSEVRTEIINQIERKLLQRYPNMRRFSTIINKDRNYSCASIGTDRFGKKSSRCESRRTRSLQSQSAKKQSMNPENEMSTHGNDANDLNLIMKQDGALRNPTRTNQQSNAEKKEEKSNRYNIFSLFRQKKKGSSSTINSSVTISSKGSKGTIRLDSIDINNNYNNNRKESVITNPVDSSNGYVRKDSSLKGKLTELNETSKANQKVSFVELTKKENYTEECINLLEKGASDKVYSNTKN